MKLTTKRRAAGLLALVGALGAGMILAAHATADVHDGEPAQHQEPTIRPWQVTATRYRFDPPRIDVLQDDLVRIDLRTGDIAHSLTIDAYRIAKRVSPGQPLTFEFRADQAGTFPFYCNLQIDDGCRLMRGVLVVRPRK
jgi:heme/copper-type cytochrome/quinol oxidase subunit 2